MAALMLSPVGCTSPSPASLSTPPVALDSPSPDLSAPGTPSETPVVPKPEPIAITPTPIVESNQATALGAAVSHVRNLPEIPDSCPAIIVEAFGAHATEACAVSYCESIGWNPNAIGKEGEVGLFQFHPRWHPEAQTFDPAENTAHAFRVSSGGTDWSQWSCKP